MLLEMLKVGEVLRKLLRCCLHMPFAADIFYIPFIDMMALLALTDRQHQFERQTQSASTWMNGMFEIC